MIIGNQEIFSLSVQVAVLSPLGRNFYLNITPNNLVRLYLRADDVPEGSLTSVRVRELSSKDWQTVEADTLESADSHRVPLTVKPPVTHVVNGQLSSDRATLFQNDSSVVGDPVQKQSLNELVSSLRRNNSSARVPGPSQPRFCVNSTSTSAVSSRGQQSEVGSSCRLQTASSKLHDWEWNQKSVSSTATTSVVAESRCLQTPRPSNGAKFQFKRTPSTPVQSPVTVQPMSNPRLRCSAPVTGTTSASHRGSTTSASVHSALTTVTHSSTTAGDDIWDTGRPSGFSWSHFSLCAVCSVAYSWHVHNGDW